MINHNRSSQFEDSFLTWIVLEPCKLNEYENYLISYLKPLLNGVSQLKYRKLETDLKITIKSKDYDVLENFAKQNNVSINTFSRFIIEYTLKNPDKLIAMINEYLENEKQN